MANNEKWINLYNTSIFEYFSPSDKAIIASIYNASEYPSSITTENGKWCVVLKSYERIVLFSEEGIFIAMSAGNVWNKRWIQL